ncbi:MAG: fibronectin type III domain-containing protein [Candidatus Marinimicrobia bacterium]|nr:fibronectin type III domain-containing protein [Candidatus Neomarinimicrobiota bacterium]
MRVFTILLSLTFVFGQGTILDNFETDIGFWKDPNYSGSTTADTSSAFAISTDYAYNGSSSGKITLIDNASTVGGWFVRMQNRTDRIDPNSKIGFWLRAHQQDVELRFVIWDNGTGGDGVGYEAGPWITPTAAVDDWEWVELDLATTPVTGWITGNGQINSTDYVTIESIQLQTSSDINDTLYIDDITFFPFNNDPPQTPLNLTATPGNHQVILSWSPNTESDIWLYKIYRYSMPPTALIDSVFHPDTTYTDTGLTNGLTYHYHITAVDSAGNESRASNTISATPTDEPTPYNNFLWSARFGGRVGNVVDLNNYIGVIDGATNSADIYDEPEPPHAPSNYLSLYFGQTGQIGGRASVLAFPVDWGNNNPMHLTIDTDLNRDQTFTLELELASTSLYGVNVFTYKYHNGMDVDYQLVWGQDSTIVTVEFLEIPNYIYLFFDDLLGYEVSFTTPPTDSTIYRLGGENLSIAFSTYISTYHLFYYSYIDETWVYVGDHVPWENTPLDDHGYFRVINTSGGLGSATSGDVIFFSNHTTLNTDWSFFSIPHSGGDGFIDDMIWHYSLPSNYYLYTYINDVGWTSTNEINHNNGYAIGLTSNYNYSFGYIDSTYDNMDLSIDIGSGWNLIGSPYNFDKNLHDARIVDYSNPTDTIPVDTAIANGWLIGTLYDYGDNSNYSITDTLQPWKSYWLAGLVDSLQFIYPSFEISPTRSTEEIWQLTLKFNQGEEVVSSINLGASPNTTDNFDAGYDYPKPPPFPENGYLNTFFYHDDWTDQFSGRFISYIISCASVQEWISYAVNDT